MRVSDICFEKIQEFEGLRLTAYKCPASVWTIGFGHTKGVKMGQTITKSQAETLLRGDLLPCEEYVRGLNLELTQGQFDALVDFCFNLGTAALQRSTLLQKIRTKADEQTIRGEFAKWVNAGGVRLQGLVKRRAWEADRFFE
jgi:lysozyme